MFPIVTGMRLVKNPPRETLAIACSESPEALTAAGVPLRRRPRDMKYMLATECSKPEVTKVMMGKKIAQTLPMMSVAAMAIQTARTTIQLQRIRGRIPGPPGGHFSGRYLERPSADRVVGEAGEINQDCDEDAADKVGRINPSPSF